jgi:ADP-heptose:LPS heptosyltransferase
MPRIFQMHNKLLKPGTVGEKQSKRGYMLRREPFNTLLCLVDRALSFLLARRSTPAIASEPRRILVSNIAHLGDVVNATAVISPLRKVFPQAEIGFLTSSWARSIIENNPEIKYVHTFDHLLLNRSRLSKWSKFIQHILSARRMLKETRKLKYEIAIDTYHFIQNSIPLLWLARIPVRIGYTSGGFGPLLTHPMPWISQDKHLVDYHLALLEPLGFSESFRRMAHPTVIVPRVAAPALPPEYLVLHAGAGAAYKQWQVEKWCELAAKLRQTGFDIVLTGSGSHEAAISARIKAVVPSAIDLVGQISFAQFVRIIQKAGLLVGVDSVAGHLAAASATPSVLIYTGANNHAQMRPFGRQSKVVTWEVPCSPCFRTNGCDGMECVRNVTVARVFQLCLETLRQTSPATTAVANYCAGSLAPEKLANNAS